LGGLTCDFAGVFEGLILWWGDRGWRVRKPCLKGETPFDKLRAGYGAPKFEAAFESGPPAHRGSSLSGLLEFGCGVFMSLFYAVRGFGCGF